MTDSNTSKKSSDRLELLYHLSQTFNSSLDLDEVLNRVMDEVITTTRAERGFVMLHEPGEDAESSGGLKFQVARGMDQKTINDPQFQISRSVVERVAHEGKPILTSDAQTDARFNIRESVMFLGLRSILCVPLNIKDKPIGVIYVDNRLQAGIFTQADLELLSAIASSAAIAIENARLYHVAVDKGRMERELQMARRVQSSLLPRETPQIPGWEFSALWQPAREVSGDYYDFIPTEFGHLGLVIADVTDKGMPAALFMASTRSIIRASLTRALSPVDGIGYANRLLCGESNDGLYVSLFFALLNLENGGLTYVNAGQNPPLLYNCVQNQLIELTSTGMPLGIDADNQYEQSTISLNHGDFILLYTDGVTDAINPHQQEFGTDRLKAVLLAQRRATSESILVSLEQAVNNFTGTHVLYDDLTIVVAKRL